MKVLIVYGSLEAMQLAVHGRGRPDIHAGPGARVAGPLASCYTIQSTRNPSDVIQGLVIAKPDHLERLQGMQYDVVIEDSSFDMMDQADWCGWFSRRYGALSGNPWDIWRKYLRAAVLR